jgi:hypothetical protein
VWNGSVALGCTHPAAFGAAWPPPAAALFVETCAHR